MSRKSQVVRRKVGSQISVSFTVAQHRCETYTDGGNDSHQKFADLRQAADNQRLGSDRTTRICIFLAATSASSSLRTK